MAITATQEGRNLHIHVEGVDPYIVKPLPGEAGAQLTQTYLAGALGEASNFDMTEAYVMALDGAVLSEVTDRWVPVEKSLRVNSNRIGQEASLSETETIASIAVYWQTVLGINGVNAYLNAGGGDAGQVKALGALAERTGLSLRRTSPSSESAAQTLSRASTRSTSTPLGGGKLGKLPLDRLPKMRRRKGA